MRSQARSIARLSLLFNKKHHSDFQGSSSYGSPAHQPRRVTCANSHVIKDDLMNINQDVHDHELDVKRNNYSDDLMECSALCSLSLPVLLMAVFRMWHFSYYQKFVKEVGFFFYGCTSCLDK